jgi:predicted nucleic acid-binding protein
MKVCVDTVILIDILKDEFRGFQDKLYDAFRKGEDLIAPVVVYAELIPQFHGDTRSLDRFLKDHRIEVHPLGVDSVTMAAKAWMKYLTRKARARCPYCDRELERREHFLSDFYIGGFALAKSDALLTRDRGIYRAYFPELVGYEGCLNG